ncbi:hypothetical protein BH23CHL8_BH23CHL8_14720 [soil metagenome]
MHVFHLRLTCSGKAIPVLFPAEDQTARLEGFADDHQRDARCVNHGCRWQC